MGTIGDRLGADLLAMFGGEGEASPEKEEVTSERDPVPSAPDDKPEPDVDGQAAGPVDGQPALGTAGTTSQVGPVSADGEPSSGDGSNVKTPSGEFGSVPKRVGAAEGVHTSESDLPPDSDEDRLRQVLLDTIVELSQLPESVVTFDSSLARDLDIHGLALWAVVAEMERQVKTQFLDEEVLGWATPKDIYSASLSALEQD